MDDVLAPHRQGELEELARRWATFRPTKVCVERRFADQGRIDEEYERFRSGILPPSHDETVQLGFRLAHTCGLSRVHAIDDDAPME